MTLALMGLLSLTGGAPVAAQMLGYNVVKARQRLQDYRHQEALAYADLAIDEENHLAKLAALNIKAMTYLDLNNQPLAEAIFHEIAKLEPEDKQGQDKFLNALYQELQESRANQHHHPQ